MQHADPAICYERAWSCLKQARLERHKGRRAILTTAAFTWRTLAGVIEDAERRRFPAPWEAKLMDGGYCIEDAAGQPMAYVYARGDAGSPGVMGRLNWDEAHRIAMDVAKLPELLRAVKHGGGEVRARKGDREVVPHDRSTAMP
jgi:hypothetical protein